MKKNLLAISLVMLLATSNSSAARLVITNNSNKPIWARINDQETGRMKGLTPKEKRAYLLEMTRTTALSLVSLGLATLAINMPETAAAFLKIDPKSRQVFYSSLVQPIRKVTFLRVIDSKPESLKRSDLIYYTSNFNKKYGPGLYAVNVRVKGIPATVYINDFNNIRTIYTDPEITIQIPVLEKFNMKTRIKGIQSNAHIKYDGWKNAERIR